MVNVYALDTNDFDKTFYEETLKKISPAKRQKIKRFVKFEDSLRSLLGEWLLHKTFNLNNIKVDLDLSSHIKLNKYKKPRLLNNQLHFNLSHSGRYVVCATSSKSIGIDVEQISSRDIIGLSKNFFCKSEHEYILNKPSSQRALAFYEIWTLKESYLKNIGVGLNANLDSFCVKINNGHIYVENDDSRYFKFYEIDKDYKLAICSNSNVFCDDITYLTPY